MTVGNGHDSAQASSEKFGASGSIVMPAVMPRALNIIVVDRLII